MASDPPFAPGPGFDDPTFSYLKRHYFDAKKLEARTMDEFARAARTGRLIAFTGSMTTLDRGYFTWDDFVNKCFELAKEELSNAELNSKYLRGDMINYARRILKQFEAETGNKKFDKRVAFSVIGEIMDIVSRYSGVSSRNLNSKIAALFLERNASVPEYTVLGNLVDRLNIDRIVTLNYDLEAEAEIARAGSTPGNVPAMLRKVSTWQDDPPSRKIVLRLPGGRSIASDVFLRERTDRLIEFAVGSAEHEYHVMHLHGRADEYQTMVVSYRDYDRLYRRSGISKVPFEHALGLLYAGNPILFVGIGMSETEVNQTLQEIIGNHPYRRIMPTFLLWNAPPAADDAERQGKKEIQRIDMLHRLGVLTLFDDDLAAEVTQLALAKLADAKPLPLADPAEGGPIPLAKPDKRHELITGAIADLATVLEGRESERLSDLSGWRTLTGRAAGNGDGVRNKVIGTWAIMPSEVLEKRSAPAPLFDEIEARAALLTIVTGTSGIRKGMAAHHLATAYQAAYPQATVVHINADFCFDTDSMLNLIAEVIWRRQGHTAKRKRSRAFQLAQPRAFHVPDRTRLLILVGGAERLFGNGGEPLSAEFDEAMRQFVASCRKPLGADKNHVKLVVIGTSRVESYFAGLTAPHSVRATAGDSIEPSDNLFRFIDYGTLADTSAGSATEEQRRPFFYLNKIIKLDIGAAATLAKLRLNQKSSPNIAAADYRRAFFAAALAPAVLTKAGLDADLALDILTIMAFIGQPVELEVLIHAPRLRRRLAGTGSRTPSFSRLKDEVEVLRSLGLVIGIAPFDVGLAMPRYGLHATLLAELRDRSGVPLSEAVLSTAFNMSLYTAQPIDGPLPERFLHNELGQLIDWLVGAYKDPAPVPDCDGPISDPRVRPDSLAALRAALAVVRGFYSTSALLSIDGDRAVPFGERDGALTEHGERLERMLAAFNASQRLIMHNPERSGIGAFYPDEIVWLHNERGVIKLAQGDLYEARAAFEEADRINRLYVEFGDSAHNWRRITLNQVLVDIERGRLPSARERMDRIEGDIGPAKVTRILELVLRPEHGPMPTDPVVSYEEMLAIGLTSGYRGLSAHVSGDIVHARRYFERATKILHRLGELRAYAIFRRHYASLPIASLGREPSDDVLDLAIATAEAAHQMDIVHEGRIRRAERRIEDGALSNLAQTNRDLTEALTYGDATDIYRVRVEAQRGLARARLASGDFEVALEHGVGALTTATRYGMSLQKIGLRVLIGQILLARGDPLSGRALIEAAIEEGKRIGYQQAIAAARQALDG